MQYAADLNTGQQLTIEEDECNTSVTLSSGGGGQQQSQRIGFATGRWMSPPELFRFGKDYIIQVNTLEGARFILVRDGQVQSMTGVPSLSGVEALPLYEAKQVSGMEPIRSMEPMTPMKPLEPLKPLDPMKPMEMQMGNMRMSMGGSHEEAETETRFCTQCGKPVKKTDRFCGYCGAKIESAS